MKNTTTLRFIACWLLLSPVLCMAQDRYNDSLALVALYNATNGANWSNPWNLSETIDNWYGLGLNENGRVNFVDLSANQLSGSIPSEIGNLTDLEVLDLYTNQLGGSIPSEIGNLVNLIRLWLSDNQLTGNIPPEIGNMTSLITVILSNNQLSGNIPIAITTLTTNLGWMFLGGNQLSGSIPSEFGNMTNLVGLGLEWNQLTGNIPPEIGNMINLDGLSLGHNQLSGSIPPEIGDISNLQVLYLQDNQLNGNIPASIWNLINLEGLFLYDNQLTGNIPAAIGNLTNLEGLSAYNNQLTGNIPASIGNLTKLKDLRLNTNQLSGSIPATIGNLDSLVLLALAGNQLTGNIPPTLGNLPKLTSLFLHTNELTGSIPAEIGNLVNLTALVLYDNQLTGNIPVEIGNLINLVDLSLGTNQLTGNIPASIENLTNLEYLVLYYNQLSGTIPAAVSDLINLKYLWIGGNNLKDTIPDLENLVQLERLDLAYNDLSGNFPNIGSYNLERLELQSNQLTGNIPAIFGSLTSLTHFNIADNQISGDIPNFSISTGLSTLHLNHNKFSFEAVEATYNSNNAVNGFQYSPQYHGEPQGYTRDFGDSLIMTLSEPLPGYNNQNVNYEWKKNYYTPIGSTDSTYTINSLTLSDVGKYTIHMTDFSRVPDLEVISEPIYVIAEGYDLYGQPVEYNQLIIKFDNWQDKEAFDNNQSILDTGAFPADSCSCNRRLYLWQFPDDSIALQILIEINGKRHTQAEDGEVDGGFNNILGVGPVAGTQGWTWTGNYPQSYPESVRVFLLDSGADTQYWNASDYLMDAAPLDSCYNIAPDSGYDYTDTLSTIKPGFADAIGHGTFGMRAIAEGTDNYMNMNVVPLKIFGGDGQGTLFNFICALYHAIDHDADIINISAGYVGQASDILEEAIALAHTKGQFIVTSTGNEGINIDSFPQYPAYYAKPFYKTAYDDTDSLVHYNNVITVAAIDAVDSLWRHSNYGSEAATIAAYGENMGGYSHTGEVVSYSGTSMSAYYVTRQLAAEIARDKTRSLQQVWMDFEANYLRNCPGTTGLTSTGKCLDIQLREVYSNLRVFLEGAFDLTGDTMRADLNTLRRVLPGQTETTFSHSAATQPYDIEPFNYEGTERVPSTFDNYPLEVVDWVLISARTEVDANTTISRTAAWLLKDGHVQLMKPLFEELTTAPDSIYIVIEHRNHMGVMSPQKLPVSNIIRLDFTTQNSYATGGTGQTMLNNLHWAMLAGETNNDIDIYDINGADKVLWKNDNGEYGFYLPTDFNMDGEINGNDKIYWFNNNGKFSSISRY